MLGESSPQSSQAILGASEQHLPLVGRLANADINTLDARQTRENVDGVCHGFERLPSWCSFHEDRFTKPNVAVLFGVACETSPLRLRRLPLVGWLRQPGDWV